MAAKDGERNHRNVAILRPPSPPFLFCYLFSFLFTRNNRETKRPGPGFLPRSAQSKWLLAGCWQKTTWWVFLGQRICPRRKQTKGICPKGTWSAPATLETGSGQCVPVKVPQTFPFLKLKKDTKKCRREYFYHGRSTRAASTGVSAFSSPSVQFHLLIVIRLHAKVDEQLAVCHPSPLLRSLPPNGNSCPHFPKTVVIVQEEYENNHPKTALA